MNSKKIGLFKYQQLILKWLLTAEQIVKIKPLVVYF